MMLLVGVRAGSNFLWLCSVLVEDSKEVFKMFNRQMAIENMKRQMKGMVAVMKSRSGMEDVGMGLSWMSLTLLGIFFLS